jgi:hypothetical protein
MKISCESALEYSNFFKVATLHVLLNRKQIEKLFLNVVFRYLEKFLVKSVLMSFGKTVYMKGENLFSRNSS